MSRFVSAGTTEEPVQRDEEWLKAQQELEANRRTKEKESQLQDGKSLYEVLQANKAAKQEAFEESIRLKHQFRSLDNDEVDFLDTVMESTRAKEAAIRRETSDQLDSFRRQQEEAERKARQDEQREDTQEDTQWRSEPRRKRKQSEKEAVKGVKIRRVSSSASDIPATASTSALSAAPPQAAHPYPPSRPAENQNQASAKVQDLTMPRMMEPEKPVVKASPSLGLGLEAYSSDED